MDKKKLFYKYTDFINLQGIGGGWVQQLKGYFPIGQWVQTIAGYQIIIWALHITWIPIWVIFIFIAVKFYAMMIVYWVVGKFAINVGVYSAQQQYNAKKEHLAPFNVEVINTFKEHTKILNMLAEKQGVDQRAENKFTEL